MQANALIWLNILSVNFSLREFSMPCAPVQTKVWTPDGLDLMAVALPRGCRFGASASRTLRWSGPTGSRARRSDGNQRRPPRLARTPQASRLPHGLGRGVLPRPLGNLACFMRRYGIAPEEIRFMAEATWEGVERATRD
jgi:hypothetical protein